MPPCSFFKVASRLSTSNYKKKKLEKVVLALFHIDQLLTQVPKSPFFSHFKICKNIHTLFWVWLQWSVLSQKRPKNIDSWFNSVLKLKLFKIKINLFAKTLVFWKFHMTRLVLACFGKLNHKSLVVGNLSFYIWT